MPMSRRGKGCPHRAALGHPSFDQCVVATPELVADELCGPRVAEGHRVLGPLHPLHDIALLARGLGDSPGGPVGVIVYLVLVDPSSDEQWQRGLQ
jgi:hypothetical protein